MSWLDEEAATDWLGTEVTAVPLMLAKPLLPSDLAERNAMLEKAWNGLKGTQQGYLLALRQNHYSLPKTLRSMKKSGNAPDRVTVARWTAGNADFAFVLRVMKSVARDEVIDPDRLLLRADQIAEDALEPKPILYKGKRTGFYENQLDTALRANEQLMKTQKMLNNDEPAGRFAEGPALIIQVVQPDGGLVNVLPKGVTIDLPEPADGNGD